MTDLAAPAKQAAAKIIFVIAHGQDAARVAHIGIETAMREHSDIQEAYRAYTDATTDGSWYAHE